MNIWCFIPRERSATVSLGNKDPIYYQKHEFSIIPSLAAWIVLVLNDNAFMRQISRLLLKIHSQASNELEMKNSSRSFQVIDTRSMARTHERCCLSAFPPLARGKQIIFRLFNHKIRQNNVCEKNEEVGDLVNVDVHGKETKLLYKLRSRQLRNRTLRQETGSRSPASYSRVFATCITCLSRDATCDMIKNKCLY